MSMNPAEKVNILLFLNIYSGANSVGIFKFFRFNYDFIG